MASISNPADKCAICLNPLQDPTKMKPCSHVFCRVCICTWILRLYQAEQESGSPATVTCPLCRQKPSHIETSGPWEVISLKPLSSYPQNTGTGWDRWGCLFSQPAMWSGTWSTGYHERAATASALAYQQIPRDKSAQDRARRERVLERLSIGTEFRPTPGRARGLERAVDGANPFDQRAVSTRDLGEDQISTSERRVPSFGWSLWSFLDGGRVDNMMF